MKTGNNVSWFRSFRSPIRNHGLINWGGVFIGLAVLLAIMAKSIGVSTQSCFEKNGLKACAQSGTLDELKQFLAPLQFTLLTEQEIQSLPHKPVDYRASQPLEWAIIKRPNHKKFYIVHLVALRNQQAIIHSRSGVIALSLTTADQVIPLQIPASEEVFPLQRKTEILVPSLAIIIAMLSLLYMSSDYTKKIAFQRNLLVVSPFLGSALRKKIVLLYDLVLAILAALTLGVFTRTVLENSFQSDFL